jgi:ABC-type lipoprotein release transport system permease subunit
MNRFAREASIIANLAWRNLWRNHRRTLIMIAATTVAVWAMIFMTALMRGMVNDMVRDGIESLPGHVQVHHPEFRDDPSIGNVIAVPDSELRKRFGDSGIETWSTRINVPAMITSERATRGVTLFGVDPAMDRSITFVADNIVDGRYLETADDSGLVVGRKLLERLETDLGKRVVLMSQDPDNEIADRGFRIVGVFSAKLEAQEETLVFAGKETVRDMLGIGDFVTEIAVQGNDYRAVEPLQQKVEELLDGDAEVLPWSQLNSYLGSMLSVMDGFVIVWTVVIFLALSFGLVNTLVMAVFERVREIGLMLALGMRPRIILAQIVVESMMLLVIGLSLGTLLSWLTVVPLQDGIDLSVVAQGMEMFGASSVLYPELTLYDIVLSNVVVLVLGFFASLSPAVRASRYEPIEAITKV